MCLLSIAPLLNHSLATEGYILRRYSPEAPLPQLLSDSGLAVFSSGKPLIVPLTEPEMVEDVLVQCGGPRHLVPILPSPVSVDCVHRLQELGYGVAVEGPGFPATESARYWLVGPEGMETESCKASVKKLRSRKKNPVHCVATGLKDWGLCETAKGEGFELLEGSFFYKPKPVLEPQKAPTEIAPIKANIMRLMNTVQDNNYEFSEIAELVRQDPALTVSLMRLVNSPYIGLRNRVRSIPQAVALLGQDEVRKWITTAVFKSMGDDSPGELTRGSLLRAKFSENLAPLFGQQDESDSIFLIGLFSSLDGILGIPMHKALEMVPMAAFLSVLLDHMGPLSLVLRFVLDYESANWEAVDEQLEEYNLQPEAVLQAYLDSLTWYDNLLKQD